MQCPFLREARVKYCEASPFRRMILELASDTASERCSSPAWTECPAATRAFDDRRAERCPFLREALTEFCSASPVTKYIPANDSLLSRCRSDGHVYCELYRERANPAVEWEGGDGGTGNGERKANRWSGRSCAGRSEATNRVRAREHRPPDHRWIDPWRAVSTVCPCPGTSPMHRITCGSTSRKTGRVTWVSMRFSRGSSALSTR